MERTERLHVTVLRQVDTWDGKDCHIDWVTEGQWTFHDTTKLIEIMDSMDDLDDGDVALSKKRLTDATTDHAARLRELEDENAKLRELVRELYHELDAATQYDAGGGRGVVSEFAGRMRELGVDA